MAYLRLIAIALVAACGQAGAQAGAAASGITPPAGWQPLFEIARAAAEGARASGVTIGGSEAWGEPARGCYAVWLRLVGDGVSAEQVLAGLASESIETKDVVQPTADTTSEGGLLSLAFGKGGYAGRMRARIERDQITALACFANDRERTICETACATLLAGGIR